MGDRQVQLLAVFGWQSEGRLVMREGACFAGKLPFLMAPQVSHLSLLVARQPRLAFFYEASLNLAFVGAGGQGPKHPPAVR